MQPCPSAQDVPATRRQQQHPKRKFNLRPTAACCEEVLRSACLMCKACCPHIPEPQILHYKSSQTTSKACPKCPDEGLRLDGCPKPTTQRDQSTLVWNRSGHRPMSQLRHTRCCPPLCAPAQGRGKKMVHDRRAGTSAKLPQVLGTDEL